MATWNDFPTEIKLMVINEIDPDEYDLLDFRLANKECNELSKKRFAQTYFTVRRHFVGKKSFQALVDISKDEFFGPYVKTVQLSAIQGDYYSWRSQPSEEERHPGEVSYHITFRRYEDCTELKSLLRQAFLNLKTYHTPLTIGIDCSWRPSEDITTEPGLYGWLVPSWEPGRLFIKNAEWADVTKNECIALDMITSVAEEVKLPVKGLKVSLYDNYMILVEEGDDYFDHHSLEPPKEPCSPDLVRDIYNYLAKSPRMDVDIDLTTGDDRDEDYPYQSMKVNYDRRAKRLTIDKTDTEDMEEFMKPWLSSIQLRSLYLTNMHIETGDHIGTLVKKHKSTMKALRMKDCRLENDYEWKRVLNSIASIPALEYLSFTNPSVKSNWNGFFNFHFGNDKRLAYTGDVQQHLSYELEAYEESVVVEDGDEDGEEEDEDDEDEDDEDEDEQEERE
ncbi:hypothetical protein KCU98_g4091, partial [Aureobasidium melanogenum]